MKLRRFYGPWFIIGCFFLFEPTVKLVDILPNTVGYLLIALSLKEINALEYRLENAMRLLYYAAAVGAVRFALMFSLFDMNNSDVLSFSTTLGILEAFLLIYFFISLYSGLNYLAMRSKSKNVLDRIDSVRTVGIVFIIVHTAATILPELTALMEWNLNADPDSYTRITLGRLKLYKNYAIVICALISTITGIWWLKETVSFMRGVKNDRSFRASIEKRYGDYVGDTPYEEFFIRLKTVLALMLAACLFSTNFRIYDDVAMRSVLIIPAWVGTVLFGICAQRLGARFFTLVPYAAYGTLQFVFGHLLTGDRWESLGSAVVPLAVFCAAVTTEQLLRKRVLQFMDVDIRTELLRQHLALGLYAVLSVTHAITGISEVNGFRIVCFVFWIGFSVWTYSAINDEIKLRRKSH